MKCYKHGQIVVLSSEIDSYTHLGTKFLVMDIIKLYIIFMPYGVDNLFKTIVTLQEAKTWSHARLSKSPAEIKAYFVTTHHTFPYQLNYIPTCQRR